MKVVNEFVKKKRKKMKAAINVAVKKISQNM